MEGQDDHRILMEESPMRSTISFRSPRTAASAAVLSLGVASLAGIAFASSAEAASSPTTLSAQSGPKAGGNALTATMLSTATNSYGAGTVTEFQYKATSTVVCSPAYTTPSATNVAATSTKVLSTKKIAVVVPDLSVGATGNWLLCTYPSATLTTALLTSSALYSVAAPPVITAGTGASQGISPATGSSLGGNTVTIYGSDFLPTATAKIGTLPLTGVVVAANGNSLTGVVPQQSATSTYYEVTVTTTGGTATLATTGYIYTNGISVSPNTTPTNVGTALTGDGTDVDIQGVGFGNIAWGVTNGSVAAVGTGAHVYLFSGAYSSVSGARTTGLKAECLNVLPISDTELICTLNTTDGDATTGGLTAVANGTYTLTVVEDGTVAAATPAASIISSGSTFTVAPY
jgi:IPT/TIG domain-containing protein